MDIQSSSRIDASSGSKSTRAPTLGRQRNSVDHLELYSRAFGKTTEGLGSDRIELLVHADPDDEIVTITAAIPAAELADIDPDTPFISFSALKHGERRAFEVTEMTVVDGKVGLRHHRDGTCVDFYCVGDIDGLVLRFEFKAWEIVGPTEGTYPYVYAEMGLVASLPESVGAHRLVTISTADSVTPRSTQGSFALAYPSRTFGDRRYLNLYFTPDRDITLRYRFGTRDHLVEPWLAIGRAVVSAAFLLFVTALASGIEIQERFLAVIASFAAVATIIWDLAGELSRFSIYGRTKRTIYGTVLSAQLLVVAALLLAMVGLRSDEATGTLSLASVVSGAIAMVLALVALTGFYLHYIGHWHGYRCDIDGCSNVLKVRRERPECRFTGRVPCSDHVSKMCAACVHYPDLIDGTLLTAAQFDPSNLPCVRKLAISDQES